MDGPGKRQPLDTASAVTVFLVLLVAIPITQEITSDDWPFLQQLLVAALVGVAVAGTVGALRILWSLVRRRRRPGGGIDS